MTSDQPGAQPVEDEFAPALRGAIVAAGISLEQLRRALERQGISVSVATLSYWQSGRSRPHRSSSLAAIGPLEECLGLPRGFLASRLPAVAGRAEERYGQSSLSLLGSDGLRPADMAAAQLGMNYRDMLWVSVHDRHLIDRTGSETVQDVRLLLQARRDGVDRYPVWFETSDMTAYPMVTAVTNCRTGRVREFRDLGGTVVEMLMERPLRAGETTLVEHRQTTLGRPTPRETIWRRVLSPSREVVLEVQFDPQVLPGRAVASSVIDDVVTSYDVPVYRTIQAHFTDNRPGQFQMSWEW